MSLENLRKQYSLDGLSESDVDSNPIEQFLKWFEQAQQVVADPSFEPNAMALATADERGRVSNRVVLLKGVSDDGFRFFTNYQSLKAKQLESNPYAALLFYWAPLERQIRVEGRIRKLSRADSQAYFDSRPLLSRISAIASPQSEVVTDRQELEELARRVAKENDSNPVAIPEYWGGYELQPDCLEFWQGRENRLHDRLQYKLSGDAQWELQRLAP